MKPELYSPLPALGAPKIEKNNPLVVNDGKETHYKWRFFLWGISTINGLRIPDKVRDLGDAPKKQSKNWVNYGKFSGICYSILQLRRFFMADPYDLGPPCGHFLWPSPSWAKDRSGRLPPLALGIPPWHRRSQRL